MATTVSLGNNAPLMADGTRAERAKSTTLVEMREGFDTLADVDLALTTANDPVLTMIARNLTNKTRKYAIGIREVEDLWSTHSSTSPAWVASSDSSFANVLGTHFNCSVGQPTNWG